MEFNTDYLTRLKTRDPDTCTSFVSSLTPVIEARLRCRFRDRDSIEDARNETFCRVFSLLDAERVREPARLGSFVWGVCDRVAHESYRRTRYMEPLPEGAGEPADARPHLDAVVIDGEMRARLRRELFRMRHADRQLLIETHFQGRDRRQMARERGITASGLNVKICRALKHLRAQVLDAGHPKPVSVRLSS